MHLDDLTSFDLLELLEQARHDLRTCKKSLAFKESLLTDLEVENAELSEVNEKLDKELKCMKRQESRRSESNAISDDCVDDGYGHWSNDEDDSASFYPTSTSEPQAKPNTCSDCEFHALEKDELFEKIEELHKQLEAVQRANELLQADLTHKSVEIADLTEALRQKQAREERLEADLEFTAAEREIALRDLHDSHNTMLSDDRFSGEYRRSSSIGSSLGDELGLRRGEIFDDFRPDVQSFTEWEKFLAEPEVEPSSESELSQIQFLQQSVLEEQPSVPGDEQEASFESVDLSLSGSLGDEIHLKEEETASPEVIPSGPQQSPSKDWDEIRYSALRSICPTLSKLLRERAHQCKPMSYLVRNRDHHSGEAEDGVEPIVDEWSSSSTRTATDEQLD